MKEEERRERSGEREGSRDEGVARGKERVELGWER